MVGGGGAHERPGHGAELAARAVQAGAQRIVAVGGDGTVHDVANGLLRHGRGGDVALGVVPIGSGNDFAKLVACIDTARCGRCGGSSPPPKRPGSTPVWCATSTS